MGGKLKDDYKAPTAAERARYIKNFKDDLCAWLKPCFEQQMEKQYQENLNAIYSRFMKMWLAMNEKYTVTLQVSGIGDWTDTDYYPRPIGLATGAYETPGISIDFTVPTVTFTGAYWMKAGCPSVLRIMGDEENTWNKDANYLTRDLALKPGLNIVDLTMPGATPSPSPSPSPTPVPDDLLEPFKGQWHGEGLPDTICITITDTYLMLPNNGVNKFYFVSYTVEDDVLVADTSSKGSLGEVDGRVTVVLLDNDHLLHALNGSSIEESIVYERVPKEREIQLPWTSTN